MFALATLAALAVAQAAPAPAFESDTTATGDIAHESIAAGNMAEAIARLESARAENPGDPALLINLGAAYAASGDYARAEECYRQAIASNDRYDLELADGRWVDSRRAARLALVSLEHRAN